MTQRNHSAASSGPLSTATVQEKSFNQVDNKKQDPFNTIDAAPEKLFGDITLKPFSEDILRGCESKQDFEDGLTNLPQCALNDVILTKIADCEANVEPTPWDDDDSDLSWQDSVLASSQGAATNNQENAADEADFVETDGTCVCAAQKTDMQVWVNQGALVTQVERNRCSICPGACAGTSTVSTSRGRVGERHASS